jgi:hypothetical protein
VEHLILVSAVPVIYPEVTALENFMGGLQDKNSIAVKTGALLRRARNLLQLVRNIVGSGRVLLTPARRGR